ncbi:MAG: hypothetical protein ACRDVM_06460 [Acidimicrobiia bacterium]
MRASPELGTPGRSPASISTRSIQPRNVSGFTSSNSPARRRAPRADSPGKSRRQSWHILTARSRVSWSYFLGAGMAQ